MAEISVSASPRQTSVPAGAMPPEISIGRMTMVGTSSLGIENGIGKVKEGIWSKGFMKKSQEEEENRAPCDRKYASCVRMVPWEYLGRVSAQQCLRTLYSCTRTSAKQRLTFSLTVHSMKLPLNNVQL
ncbi:hypothetical protein PIB30_087964 [Stylosanthes scabra]|uniref:Uncharacterized protein n=1 Tax=Stylosanthes scabra TaxID=79078 RepID=A0ABU6TU31_9FABA|nr:hypothetical protein [Stylosanthes scabra]